MNNNTHRYIFIDYNDLKEIKFKKLEKVCDKVFILINQDIKLIPFSLVQQLQRLGKGVKWIPLDESAKDYNLHISFLMGKLHTKVNPDIEFAILSNNPDFDSLVLFINSEGRSCLRVKRKNSRQEKSSAANVIASDTEGDATITTDSSDFIQNRFLTKDPTIKTNYIAETANETLNRLKRSGTRPGDIGILKSYIMLNNQELTESSNVDKIIEQLESNNDIRVREGEVFYNF